MKLGVLIFFLVYGFYQSLALAVLGGGSSSDLIGTGFKEESTVHPEREVLQKELQYKVKESGTAISDLYFEKEIQEAKELFAKLQHQNEIENIEFVYLRELIEFLKDKTNGYMRGEYLLSAAKIIYHQILNNKAMGSGILEMTAIELKAVMDIQKRSSHFDAKLLLESSIKRVDFLLGEIQNNKNNDVVKKYYYDVLEDFLSAETEGFTQGALLPTAKHSLQELYRNESLPEDLRRQAYEMTDL